MSFMSFQSSKLFAASHSDRSHKRGCIFCDIVVKGGSKVIYEDATLVAFKDIRPAAAVHLLVIPRAHIATVYDLRAGPDDARLVEEMLSTGRALLEKYASGAEHKFGFHYPRFNSVDHLHMHCFALPHKCWAWMVYLEAEPVRRGFITAKQLLQFLHAAPAAEGHSHRHKSGGRMCRAALDILHVKLAQLRA